ncbi:Ribosomal RNA small subunit methyltransferase B [Methylophilaceae bacterium]|nr:Ribosomal RNA small subunit methyltransferase B [Methylophilaceae bacterium]
MHIAQQLAAHAVGQVFAGRNLTSALEAAFQAHPDITSQQRAVAQDLSYGTLRFHGRLDALLALLVERPVTDTGVRCLLLVALYQLNYDRASAHTIVNQAVEAAKHFRKPWAAGLVNAVLRNFLRNRDTIDQRLADSDVVRYSYPQWWVNKLKKQYPDQWQAVLETGNQHPPMTLRVNLNRQSVTEYAAMLDENGIAYQLHGKQAVILDKPLPVDQLPGFFEGAVSVQDYGAQFAAGLLDVADGMRVLDACCAPGGKTGHILESAAAELVALDADEMRLRRVSQNLDRLGLQASLLAGDAAEPDRWWDGRPFDRILADVPCTASGVVRRHVDIKWLRRESDIALFAAQQAAILHALWRLLAKGGKLLYATCSIFHEENQQQIDRFLEQQADAKQLPLIYPQHGQLIPCAQHDGFFYALLQKD